MFARILVAINDSGQHPAAVDLVKSVATDGATQVRVLHLRLRELSGFSWYARETGTEAAFVAEAAVFNLRMAGLAAGGGARSGGDGPGRPGTPAEAKAILAGPLMIGSASSGELASRPFGRQSPP